MTTIGIIVAMSKEFNQLRQIINSPEEENLHGFSFVRGTLGNNQIILLQCGIGKVCSALGTAEMINHFHPDIVINSGVAGALNPKLKIMDIVIGTSTVYHDVYCGSDCQLGQIQNFPLYYPAAENLLAKVKIFADSNHIHFGLICSGDQFVSSPQALQTIQHNFPEGLAVDMESCSIAHTCHMYNTPFISLRIISDTPGVTEHETQYNNFWEQAPEVSFALMRQLLEIL